MSRISRRAMVLGLCLASTSSAAAPRQSAQQEQPDSATIGAAIAELDRLHQELVRRRQALEAGQPVEPDGERMFEAQVRLVQVLIKSEDPIVIRPLVSTMVGTPVMNAVAAFGELAVADVMAAAADPYADQRINALKTLQRMLEGQVRHPLSPASMQWIIVVAQQRLLQEQSPVVIWNAVDLAAATKDPVLIDMVRRIASNGAEVRALGIIGPRDIEQTQKRARAALTARGLR